MFEDTRFAEPVSRQQLAAFDALGPIVPPLLPPCSDKSLIEEQKATRRIAGAHSIGLSESPG